MSRRLFSQRERNSYGDIPWHTLTSKPRVLQSGISTQSVRLLTQRDSAVEAKWMPLQSRHETRR